MSDPSDIDARPAKRARLDHSTAPSLSTAPAAPQFAIDEDLEREVRAGITEYVCPDNLGFTGVLKQRYTDFLVNEIGLDGVVLHLRDMDVPQTEAVRRNDEGKGGIKSGDGGKDKVVMVIKEEKENGDTKVVTKNEKENGDTKVFIKEENGDTETTNGAPVAVVKTEDAPQDATPVKLKNVQQEDIKQEPEEELAEEDRNTLHSIFGEDTTTKILTLVGQMRRREQRKAKDFKAVISPPITDKDTRTQAHQSLRRMFPNLLESTMEADQSIRIKATPPSERKGKGRGNNRDAPSRSKGQAGWDERGGEYLHFTLYKENKDTMEIVGFLGSKLNSGAKAFGFAGTKDRRACTAQRVCVKRQTAERMFNFNKVLYNAAMGDWKYEAHDLRLGDLKGNEFTITLRHCHFQGEDGLDLVHRHVLANKIVGKAIKDFSDKGFINYYGLQRFGSFSASTDAIGCKMLQDDLKGAVEDILAYNDVALAAADEELPSDSNVLVSHDDRHRAKALHTWKTEGKGNAALDILPRKFTAERNIIQHLSSRNGRNGQYDRVSDWQGALMTIPRNLRLMYVHAYQSLVWNVVAGRRWATHGDSVIEGDLVLVHEHREKEAKHVPIKKEETDTNGEFVINPTGTENANANGRDFERARALTAQEAASGLYTIWDVVLPQPGYDVEYPKNSIGDFYTVFMGSEKGGKLDPHNMRRGWREVSLSGGYRKFLARPLEPLTFDVYRYTKEDEQFVETDLQRLQKERGEEFGPARRERSGAEEKAEDVEMEEGEEKEVVQEKLAVVIKLQLASSQYATMALRELMKAGGVKAYKPEFMGGR
jgi:tRNA pseudouridine13 synthase